MMKGYELTDFEWDVIAPLLPEPIDRNNTAGDVWPHTAYRSKSQLLADPAHDLERAKTVTYQKGDPRSPDILL